jgi:hypothetical protein
MKYLCLILITVTLLIKSCSDDQNKNNTSTTGSTTNTATTQNGADNMTVDYTKDLFDENGRPIVVIAGSDNGTFDQFGRPQKALGSIALAFGINAMSDKGGELYCPSGTNSLTATLTRAIDNITITGNGKASYVTIDRSTPVIRIGGKGWLIENLKLDEGGIGCPTFYHYAVRNVWIGNRYYPYYDTNYQYGRKISINNSTIAETLVNFKVLVRLNSSNFDFSLCKSDGSDIFFVGSDGSTLNYEIERWDAPNKAADIWVKVPSITANVNTSYFWFYYSNPNAIDQQSSPWDSNYILVAHMKDFPSAGFLKDSANLGTFYKGGSGNPTETTALLGKSQDFNGTTSYAVGLDPDYTQFWLDTNPLAIVGNVYQAIVTPEGNIAYVTTRNGAGIGIAEYSVSKRKLIFSHTESLWDNDHGPESISKFADGNYLTSDCDSGSLMYEITPSGQNVWSLNVGGGAMCRVISVDGIECMLVEQQSPKAVKIYRRNDRSELWSWNAGTYPNDADYRVIGGVKKIVVADYQDHTIKIIDYATKNTDWTYTLTGATAGPYNICWVDDTHLVFSTGNSHQVKIIRTTDNTITWASNTFGSSTIGCRLWGTDKVVTTNNNGVFICDISAAPPAITALSVSAIITPDAFATYNTIVGHSGSDVTGAGYTLALRADGTLQFICFDAAGNGHHIISNTVLSAGTTYRVRGVLSSNTIKLYINGILDSATPIAVIGGTIVSDYALAIGSWHNHSGDWFDGKIDEVRIEKTAPTLPYLAAEELNFANTYLTFGPEQFAGVN